MSVKSKQKRSKGKGKPLEHKEPSVRQAKAMQNVIENHGNVSKAMRDAGYPATTAKNPRNLTESKAWQQLMTKFLPDASLVKIHKELLNAHRMDHMVFPLGPDSKLKKLDTKEMPEAIKTILDAEEALKMTSLTDKEITALLATVNCTVRKIVHGQTGRHVYFWAPDNKARKEAVDLAYKLKGRYAPEKHDHNMKGSIVYLPPKK